MLSHDFFAIFQKHHDSGRDDSGLTTGIGFSRA
jgi:hypothetical protein